MDSATKGGGESGERGVRVGMNGTSRGWGGHSGMKPKYERCVSNRHMPDRKSVV